MNQEVKSYATNLQNIYSLCLNLLQRETELTPRHLLLSLSLLNLLSILTIFETHLKNNQTDQHSRYVTESQNSLTRKEPTSLVERNALESERIDWREIKGFSRRKF
ncbi:hypothetical protein KKC1_00250 [Calderihabitans maritimus]|uniref:Uncharacterized protein n=1 Tax=Calderihabitans maritimus TaxID=1246530 RepID=A0A1Z5HMW7_9FIRM|nr:hypothetical protein KKC1_00250 [Calderihabitans maritimus]